MGLGLAIIPQPGNARLPLHAASLSFAIIGSGDVVGNAENSSDGQLKQPFIASDHLQVA